MLSASALLSSHPEFGAFEFPTFRKWLTSVHDHVIPHARNNYHPHLLSHRMLGLLSLLLMTVKVVSVSLLAIGPAGAVTASAITTETVISLANAARTQNQLNELTPNGLLTRAAQNKANDMLARQYFSHNTPDGATPWTFIKDTGYSYITAGENLAIDFSEAESVQSAWMNSPGHRANILNKNFQEIGIGIAKGKFDGHDTTIVVQMFGTPIAQQVTTQPQPTEVLQPQTPAQVTAPASTPAQSSAPAQQQAAPAPTAAPETQSAPTTLNPVSQETLGVSSTDVAMQGSDLYISVTATSNATKILAIYGDNSVMLDPIGNNIWKATIPLSKVSQYDNLVVQAHDMYGHIHQEPVAQFSESLKPVFRSSGDVEGASVKVFGTEINPQLLEEKVLLIAIAVLLTGLILAIAIKRHIQHVSLIANTSFVAMLAAILLMV